mmetsp:Transcript_15805/g.40173  ORF Transcript_15805/g.40173 Transcript_15805/m.40173 type:complete len:214 (-) Transcript_15805:143-784(-)
MHSEHQSQCLDQSGQRHTGLRRLLRSLLPGLETCSFQRGDRDCERLGRRGELEALEGVLQTLDLATREALCPPVCDEELHDVVEVHPVIGTEAQAAEDLLDQHAMRRETYGPQQVRQPRDVHLGSLLIAEIGESCAENRVFVLGEPLEEAKDLVEVHLLVRRHLVRKLGDLISRDSRIADILHKLVEVIFVDLRGVRHVEAPESSLRSSSLSI